MSEDPYRTSENAARYFGDKEDLSKFENGITKRLGWVRFYAIISIVFGALNSILIITIPIFTWIMIKSGILILKSATCFENARAMQSEEDYQEALEKLGHGMKLNGLSWLIYSIFWIVASIGFFVFAIVMEIDNF